jgi:AraC-like DNA-binding protein
VSEALVTTSALPFEYVEQPVSGQLSDMAVSTWTARGTIAYGRERILPTPDPVLIVTLGAPFRIRAAASGEPARLYRRGWLVGPQTRFVENEPVAETDVVGVTLRPWGISALFGIGATQAADHVLDLEDLWGPGLEGLRERMATLADATGRQDLLAAELAARRRTGPPRTLVQAARRLAETQGPGVTQLSSELGVSRKHLHELFARHVGLAPRTFARLHRFGRALRALAETPPPTLSGVAQAAGYFDQAHMNRDFAAFGALTPTEYLLLRAVHLPPDEDDSGLFVPSL